MIKFPYPVLTPEGSSYKENINFEIVFVRNFSFSEKMSFEFNVNMNSEVLKAMMENSEAKMYIKVQTSIFTEVQEVVDFTGNIQCSLAFENIESNDIIRFTGYVICNKNLIFGYNDELVDLYDSDYNVSLKKNDVLAISNEESLSYNSSNNDFIRFSPHTEQNGKGFYVSYETNYITVHVGTDFNTAYGLVKNNHRDTCTIFDSHLIFEVFVCTLIDLAQDFDEHKDSEWFKLFEQIYMQVSDLKFEDFIEQFKADSFIDMQQIFEVAHRMTNNQIENSIISLSKREEK